MSRIGLHMTTRDIVIEMCDGNPGGLNVLMLLMRDGAAIDPDAMMGPLASLLSLDQHKIYGSRIWCLYKDVCRCDLTKLVACLRGVQLGILSEATLNRAIDNRGEGVDVEAVLAAVQKRLPRFGATAKTEPPAVSP